MREERKPGWCLGLWISSEGTGAGVGGGTGHTWDAARLRWVGWEQGLKLEVAEIGPDLVLGGRRAACGFCRSGKSLEAEEGQVDLSAQSSLLKSP